MDFQPEHTDVAIIGGGMGGLTAATYLAREGVGVTLFEKAADLGGRAASQNVDGYLFNRGVHALYTGGATEHVLKELNIPYSGHIPHGVFLLRDGKLHLAPYDSSTLFCTSAFTLADKLELMRLFTSFGKINARALAGISAQAWLDRHLHRPAVHAYLTAFARTYVYSTALDLVSADVFVDKLQVSAKHPVIYIDGGWQAFIDGLRDAAIRAGARIVSGARVEAVEYADGQAQGVRLRDGGHVSAQAVIIATAPKDAVKLVDDGSYRPLRQIVDALIPAQVACLDVALSRLPDPSHPVVQDVEHARFMSAQSLFSRVAPDDGALVYTFKQLDPRQSSDPHEDERELEGLLDTVHSGWRELVVKRQFLPRIDAVGALPTVASGGLNGRPGPHVPGIENLYLVGDWIGPDSFLSDPSLSSARDVAAMIRESLPALRLSASPVL